MSPWESELALPKFVHERPQEEAMTTVRRYMGSTEFARWQINGAALPPSWHEAMEQLARNARAH